MEPHESRPGYVDVHSHVVPSGDDGAPSVAEGLAMCRSAVAAGTRTLFATPHMHAPFDQYPWTPEREALFAQAFEVMRPLAAELGLDLRRGREVFPSELGDGDLAALALEGTRGVLVEFPGGWLDVADPVALTWRAAERVEASGLLPVLAHPERCPAIREDPERAAPFAARGWLLCPNSGSLTGEHGDHAQATAWELLERGQATLVASDAHRLPGRPPDLSAAADLLATRLGERVARFVLTGAALPWLPGRSPGASLAA